MLLPCLARFLYSCKTFQVPPEPFLETRVVHIRNRHRNLYRDWHRNLHRDWHRNHRLLDPSLGGIHFNIISRVGETRGMTCLSRVSKWGSSNYWGCVKNPAW